MREQASPQGPPVAAAKDAPNGWNIWQPLQCFLLAATTAPYRRAFKLYTWRPMRDFRAAKGDRTLLIPLVRDWKADKYAELQAVQVAATFCGGAAFSSLPWSRTSNAIWIADALWFSSLLCSIFAIITSIQTKSMLDDLPSREQLTSALPDNEVQRMRQTILRYKRTPGIKHWIMVFVWQFPSMTMTYAWCTFIAGLTVYICTPFIQRLPWQDRHKIAVAYLAFGLVGVLTYISATIFVYVGEKDYERSVANSRASTLANTGSSTLANANVGFGEAEAGASPTRVEAQAQMQQDATIPTIVEIPDPVQAARSKALIGFDHSESPKMVPEQSRSNPRLLF
ncbi:hypothetical protein BKA63DRAFT_251805 [Paraphoma chrysanthemicola]|nr:hypothetical protein BKA63DRAFT_251805 [Paraphoma chrysanthemicola]